MEERAVICRGCDFILDTGFLGADILDEEKALRPGAGGVDPAAFNLADAVILGSIDDNSQSFETVDSGFHQLKANFAARLYVSGQSQALMAPDAVPAITQPSDGMRLTPFERHVLAFIDGKRPVEHIHRAAGLEEAEVKTALATLADKGVVKVVGRIFADLDAPDDPGSAVVRRAPRVRARNASVGAVALVGDEADRAIEDAFRTQVRALRPDFAQPPPDGEVFGPSGGRDRAARRIDDGAEDGADSDDDGPTTASGRAGALRPAAQRGPVNRQGGPTHAQTRGDAGSSMEDPSEESLPEMSADQSIVGTGDIGQSDDDGDAPNGADPRQASGLQAEDEDEAHDGGGTGRVHQQSSDGFDDFESGADVATALVAKQSLGSSMPSHLNSDHNRSGVFADASEAVRRPSFQDLADSRMVQRPPVIDPQPGGRSAPVGAPRGSAPRPALGRPGAPVPPAGASPDPSRAEHRRGESSAMWEGEGTPATGSQAAQSALSGRGRAQDRSASLSSLLEHSTVGMVDAEPRTRARGPRATGRATSPIDDSEPTGVVPGGSGVDASGSTSLRTPPVPGERRGAFDEPSASFDGPTGPDVRSATDKLPSVQNSFRDLRMQLRADVRPERGPPLVAASDAAPSGFSGTRSGAGRAVDASEEVVDSKLLIRPVAGTGDAARYPPAPIEHDDSAEAVTGKAAHGRKDFAGTPGAAARKPAPKLEHHEDNDEDEEEEEQVEADPEATMTLDPEAQKRRFGRQVPGGEEVAVDASRGAARLSSGYAKTAATSEGSPSREQDDYIRKARKLYEEAMKEAQAGRISAARMNVRLANIYDPENSEYSRQLEVWEGGGTSAGKAAERQGDVTVRPTSAEDSLAEIKALYDDAQRQEDAGDVDSALQLLKRGVERYPSAAALHNRIGVILALRKRDFQGAVNAIQRAVDIDPENLHYKSNLGKIVARLQRGDS